MYELSDDDDSFTFPESSSTIQNGRKCAILISSDEESTDRPYEVTELSSDSDELPEVEVVQKTIAIKNLFQPKNDNSTEVVKKKSASKVLFPPSNLTNDVNVTVPPVEKTIQQPLPFRVLGLEVKMPVQPYRCQLNLMHKIITGIKKSENCILESPTGSGKTLALLCGVLAWQQHELNRISQEQAQALAQNYYKDYPDLNRGDVTDYIASPTTKKVDVTPQDLFAKNHFGEKSIYHTSEETPGHSTTSNKRAGPYMDEVDDDDPMEGLVSIHKKRRQGSIEPGNMPSNLELTPEKPIKPEQKETPEEVRKLYALVDNLRFRTSMTVDCSVPTIYYGARTHTQLQQVIKEFKRTYYCGLVKMSLLSSRRMSCIREFNRDQWKSKDDMCRACVKSLTANEDRKKNSDTNCKYFDNRTALNHNNLPPAFDLEDLVIAGEKREACPYYAARAMAKVANIVFCPYNYLIDPSIRSSMQISLRGSIVLIDEAHNIENICRDSASFQYTQTKVQDALKELEKVSESRYANHDVISYIDQLILTLRNWNDWFTNQVPLTKSAPVNSNKATYEWNTHNFVQTLANHNIGYAHFHSFKSNADAFCTRLREDPRTLLGVTQATGTLLESLAIGLDYLFRDDCKHLDDYKPALECDSNELLTLHLHCLNPGIIMTPLKEARCVILASGTLTPLGSMEAELQTTFPQVAMPNHIIPEERVWVGTVSGDGSGAQKYTANDIKQPVTAERLGRILTRVCRLTPHGVLCFLPSYNALYTLKNTWQSTGVWDELKQLKHVFVEQRKDGHDEMMKDFYECVATPRGALLLAVYRGKVSEGMDFKDHQARAVVCVGIPYLSKFDTAVKAKLEYNEKKKSDRGLLNENEWMRVQAYRALNQAVGRSIRHKGDWGAVLLVDARYTQPYFTEHLSGWVLKFLGNNHHTYESLQSGSNSLAEFMHRMQLDG